MNDSRDILRSLGSRAVQALAGLFALSWIGIVVFPVTRLGLAVLLLSAALLTYLYRRNFTVRKTIAALAVSGIAVFTANIAAISGFKGSAYIFSCSALSISCARVRKVQAFDRTVLVVPVWGPKTGLLRFLLGSEDGVYFPRIHRHDGNAIMHAPLEEQALQDAELPDPRGRSSFHLEVNLAVPHFSIVKADEGDKFDVSLGMSNALIEGLDFESGLSRAVPGQFSISSTGDPGPEEWRRLVFANETIRSLMTDSAASVVAKLSEEASRTGRMDDYVRYETIRMSLGKGFYPDLPGTSQRLFELRSAIRKVDADSDFRIAADHPWNRAFILAAMQTLEDLREVYLQSRPGQKRRRADGTAISIRASPIPWEPERSWIADKGQRILADAAANSRYSQALLDTFFKGALGGLGTALRTVEEMNPPDRESLGAARILESSQPFEYLVAQWLDEVPEAKTRRVAVMANQIEAAVVRLTMVGMSEGFAQLGGGDDELTPGGRRLVLRKFRAIRSELEVYAARLRILRSFAVTEFQRIDLSRERETLDPLFNLFEQVLTCEASEDACQAAAIETSRSFVDKIGHPNSSFNMMMQIALDERGSAPYAATSLKRLLGSVAPAMTPREIDQAAVPYLIMLVRTLDTDMRPFMPELCRAADRYSSALLSETHSEKRIILHEAAILLAETCERKWGSKHRLVLNSGGLDPGPWVTILQSKIVQQRDAGTRSIVVSRMTRPGDRRNS